MSELMTPIPFRQLMTWISAEYARDGSVFGVQRPFHPSGKMLPIFGETIETPFGPAAGPNTQLAQNIIAGYFAGARFFELKTVQKMDGAELAACINRPCILAEDECYNCEWSTELTVPQAFAEYVKAWCACKMLARRYGLGDANGFVFNMSVGYDLEGIKGEKVDTFLNGMMDAAKTPVFQECIAVLHELFPEDSDYIDTISPHISRSVTLSTLHGCPPEEIERIASYLITEKGLHTFVKCNPTLLGYETARSILDEMGYDYIAFDDHHFKEDLQYEDAVPMFRRLEKLAAERGLEFGLKLSNTFPVDVKAGELPSEEMYMAGKSLYPLTTAMAARLSREFDGKLRLSYAGGADAFNIDKLFVCGIWPITMATTELKPGGYQRFTQIGEILERFPFEPFSGVDSLAVNELARSARHDKYHLKDIKPLPRRKLTEKVPLLDCFTAPCEGGCPIRQDIPEYMELCRTGRYTEALTLITEKNPLPFTTGTICAHRCQTKCTRNYYDESVHIRETKLVAAENGYDALMRSLKKPAPVTDGRKAAIIGGGPTGIAAAYFLGRAGIPVTVFERSSRLGGVPMQVIPGFRISEAAIEKDIALMQFYGAEIRLNTPAPSVAELNVAGYTHIFFAVGAGKAGRLNIPGNVVPVIQWLRDLKAGKKVSLGHVAVIGGGNVSMDATRTAIRLGASAVTCVYRRRVTDMTALAEEIEEAQSEGCQILSLQAPDHIETDETGRVTALWTRPQVIGAYGKDGRPRPYDADQPLLRTPCDVVIVAIGQSIDAKPFEQIAPVVRGKIQAESDAFVPNTPHVFAGGDAVTGPATVIRAVAAGKVAAANIDAHLGFRHVIKSDVEIPAPHLTNMPACGRIELRSRPAEECVGNFDLVKCGMTEQEVHQETSRCLRCDHFGYGIFKGGRSSKW